MSFNLNPKLATEDWADEAIADRAGLSVEDVRDMRDVRKVVRLSVLPPGMNLSLDWEGDTFALRVETARAGFRILKDRWITLDCYRYAAFPVIPGVVEDLCRSLTRPRPDTTNTGWAATFGLILCALTMIAATCDRPPSGDCVSCLASKPPMECAAVCAPGPPTSVATPTVTPSSPPEPTRTATPTGSASPSPSPSEGPSPSPTTSVKAQAPYLSEWKVLLGKGTKPAAEACSGGVQVRPDGLLKCLKDTTDFYATDDPDKRWPMCRSVGTPECACHKEPGDPNPPKCEVDPCLKLTCSGGQSQFGAAPREWGDPRGPEFDIKGAVSWQKAANPWQVIIVAQKGAKVKVKACAPPNMTTEDGIPVPVKKDSCGEGTLTF